MAILSIERDRPQLVQRDADPLTYNAAAQRLYGDQLLFDMCADDALVSLSMFGAYPPLLDWLGWSATKVFRRQQYFLTYAGAAGIAAGTPTSGVHADPCAPGASVEWGACDIVTEGFGRIRRSAPVRDLTRMDVKFCEKQPFYRFDGSQITSEFEWDLRLTTGTLVNDLAGLVVTGNKSNANEFDGLLNLIAYGYESSTGDACPGLDSLVFDYNDNVMLPDAGAADVTLNGVAVTDGFNFVDLLYFAMRRIRINASQSSMGERFAPGDQVLVMPHEWINCLLDAWTCWVKCGGDFTRMDAFEARNYRDSLNGGLYGYGVLRGLDGVDLPIIAHDHGLINIPVDPEANPYTATILLLTKNIGGQPVMRGEFNDQRSAAQQRAGYDTYDNGLILSWENFDNTCEQTNAQIEPRLWNRAPWASARFDNVLCTTVGAAPRSLDPTSPLFFQGNVTKYVPA